MSETAKIFEAIGGLTEAVNGLRRDFEKFDRESSENQLIVRQRLNDLTERMATVETKISAVKQDIADDVMPTIQKVKIWEQRGIGFLAAAGMVGTGIGAAFASFLSYYWEKLQKLLGSV